MDAFKILTVLVTATLEIIYRKRMTCRYWLLYLNTEQPYKWRVLKKGLGGVELSGSALV